jgi:hypothetical protein
MRRFSVGAYNECLKKFARQREGANHAPRLPSLVLSTCIWRAS